MTDSRMRLVRTWLYASRYFYGLWSMADGDLWLEVLATFGGGDRLSATVGVFTSGADALKSTFTASVLSSLASSKPPSMLVIWRTPPTSEIGGIGESICSSPGV